MRLEPPASALDPAAFAIGGRVPSTAFAPANADELCTLLRDCAAEGRAAVLFGGGTLQSLGNVPARYDVALSLIRMARVVEYEHRDLTIAVEAGMTLASLGATLAERGQFVPLDAPRAALATVGGTLASGWLGPRRTAYARPRDLLIGTTVVLADGTLAKAGGMVVKNATGYDLSKLYVGSLGTLGAIVRANFKTLPLPAARRVAVAVIPEGYGERVVAHLNALTIEPVAALVVRGYEHEVDLAPQDDAGAARLVALFEGSQFVVDRATRDLRSALGAAGVAATHLIDREAARAFERTIDAYVASLGTRSATYRSAGIPSEAAERLAAFARLARATQLRMESIEDLRSGDAIVRLSSYTGEKFAQRLLDFDAGRSSELSSARIIAAPEGLRAQLNVWGTQPPSIGAMRALKTRFDPQGTLAPGRQVGGI